jgi:hypothetical protein
MKEYRKIEIHRLLYYHREDFVTKSRYFDSPNCVGCIYKGSSYCWGQCSLNIWKKDREY